MLKVSTYSEVKRFDLARTIAGRGRYWTTAYLLDDVLIDSGCAHSVPELAHALAGMSLSRIVNTHSHEDHIGGNGILQGGREGLEIYAHPLALPVLANPRIEQPLHYYRRIFWGWPDPSQALPISDGEMIPTGKHTLQVLYTPGHSEDHICLYEPEKRWLFTGDLFVGGQDRALRADCDIWQIIDSLKRMAELPIDRLLPGCARVRDNPDEELREKINYLEEIGERVVRLHALGWSVGRITRSVCGSFMPIELVTLGHFSRQWLVRSYLGLKDQ
jgi:glyoxylase-like metal-dependent hydrolase (beta-lactamase superfamily II)